MTIILSDAQQNAKEKLENSLGRIPRWNFQKYEEFNEYMKFLIKKIKRSINIKKTIDSGKISYTEMNEKRKLKTLEYYNIEKNLKSYAIKYYEKYMPSNKKLLNKLIEKSKNEELANKILDWLLETNYIMTDNQIALQYFNYYIAMWNNYNKINNSLRKKLFPKDIIDELINNSKELTNHSLLDPFSLRKKIEWLLNKWKSEYFIKQKLADTNYDRELIKSILVDLNFDNSEIIQKELKKFQDKWFDKNKIVQKMNYKWYRYWDYSQFLD